MATYCYSNKDGLVERFYPMGKAPRRIRVDGKTLYRDIAAEWGRVFPGARSSMIAGWPMTSVACACNPDEVGQFVSESIRRGVPTERTRDGRAIFTSRSHRANYLKAFGLVDHDGGYRETY